MKKVIGIIFRVIGAILLALIEMLFYLLPLLVSAAIFIFAFNQSFGIGLVIMLGLIVVQLILSLTDTFSWTEFEELSFSRVWDDDKLAKRFNISFNLARVSTIIATLFFIFNSGVILNPFGDIGITIAIVILIISLLLFLFTNELEDYQKLRGCLAIVIIISVLTFAYLYFGTQLIWIPALLSLASSYSKMFWELDDEEYGGFSFVVPILLGLISIISTIIQFWKEIFNWVSELFNSIVEVIASILTFELFYVQLWVYISAFIVCFIISKIVKVIVKKSAEKSARLIELAEKKEKEDKKAKEYQEKEAARVSKANFLKNIGAGASISEEEVVFVVERTNYFYQEEIAKILTHARLFDSFVVVSAVKKQIFYQPRLNNVLSLYNDSFKRTTDDKILYGLISVMDDLIEGATKSKPYKGADELLLTISNICKDFPQFQKKEEE